MSCLSPRARAWLLGRAVTHGEQDHFVCGRPFTRGEHCYEQDVRAMVRGYLVVKFRPEEHGPDGWEGDAYSDPNAPPIFTKHQRMFLDAGVAVITERTEFEPTRIYSGKRGIRRPTCPDCIVALDNALQMTKQLHWTLWRAQQFPERQRARGFPRARCFR